jgi:hypothetical protein
MAAYRGAHLPATSKYIYINESIILVESHCYNTKETKDKKRPIEEEPKVFVRRGRAT